jgi:uncharacterized integral membrane protein (TIGR00698 family)
MKTGIGKVIPGLGLLAVVAGAARLLGSAIPFLTPLIIAVALGAVIANVAGPPNWAKPGIEKHSLFLETAIVLLGASLSLDSIVAAGPVVVALVLFVVGFGIVLVILISNLADLDERTGSLLAAGSSICGISAVAAVAPVCEAREHQIAHAAATILLFDAVTLVAFPIVGESLDLGSQFYGIWIGLSMFSTGPVAAAGFAHSVAAGEWATITKLARNALIGIVVLGFSVWYANQDDTESSHSMRRLWTDFPKFLIGFIALAAIANTGVLSTTVLDLIGVASNVLFLVAFAGLGFEIRLGEMREAGLLPVGVVGAYLLIISGITYLLVTVMF